MPYVIAAIILLALLVIFSIIRKGSYYRKIFSDDHYAEIASWAKEVLKIHPAEESSLEDGTAVLTSAGLALAYTSDTEGRSRSVHFSVSQLNNFTTSAVGGRIIFLLISLLSKNECEVGVFKTQSSVHHAVFEMHEQNEWKTEEIDKVIADMQNYQPLPISDVRVAM